MSNRVFLRRVTPEEKQQVQRLARSQTAPIRLVQRARIIAGMLDAPELSATAAGIRAGLSNAVGAKWVGRFNQEGLAGLEDRPRSGRPRTHSEAVRSELIGLALQKPSALGYPFALWTLERLQDAFFEREGVHLSDSTIWTWMDEEGLMQKSLRWRRQESWFRDPEKRDPEFAEKRGPSLPHTSARS
ncbi:MAG: helix-turn-helix domain-containing protein [Bacteroidetes bacterium]|jgi:transposase|nr:helix-turn-helix domain-containing protein [Bacteroidota bacterium]